MLMHAFGASDVGRTRSINEDSFLCDQELGLFMVCDGMGGHSAGEVASAHTIQIVHQTAREHLLALNQGQISAEMLVLILRGAIEKACAEIYQEGLRDKSKKGMGTTCTALWIVGSQGVLAHVGDSRLMILRSGSLVQLTQDHTYLAEALRHGLIQPEEAEKSPYRNVVTRAVGPQPTVIVDSLVFDVADGDTMLLCSDGLHQYTNDVAELLHILDKADLQRSTEQLINLANQRGGSDNITAVIIQLRDATLVQQNGTQNGETSDANVSINTLRHIELLQDLSLPEVVRLCQAFQKIQINPNEFLVRENETSDSFFVIVQGSVEILKNNQRVAVLQSGAHFGEMALLNARPRTASVKTLEPTRLLVTKRDTLYSFLQTDPLLAARFFYKLAQKLSLRLDEAYDDTQPAKKTIDERDTLRFGV